MPDTDILPEAEWRVDILEGADATQSVMLTEGVELVVGRSSSCELVFSSPSVSRRHCVLRIKDHAPEVEDLGAKKPVRVNGVDAQPGQPVRLQHGDILQVGGSSGGRIEIINVRHAEAGAGVPDGEETRAELCDDDETVIRADTALGDNDTQATAFDPVDRDEDDTKTRCPDPDQTVFVDRDGMMSASVLDEGEEEEDAATGYLPQEDVKDILEGTSRKRKKIITSVCIAGIILLALSLLRTDPNDPGEGSAALHQGTFFTCEIPDGWRVQSRGTVVLFRSGAALQREGVALLRYSDEQCRWWTYERNFPEMMQRLVDELSFLKDIGWNAVRGEQTGSLQRFRLHESTAPFVVFEGDAEAGRMVARARFYLVGSDAVLSVAWNSSGQLTGRGRTLWEGLDLDLNGQDVDRRAVGDLGMVQARNYNEALLQMEEARRWRANASVAHGNLWRAYQAVLAAHRWFCEHPADHPAQRREMENAWRLLDEIAAGLNDVFMELQKEAVVAREARDATRLRYYADLIQQEFPNRSDYRWIWAERQRSSQR